MRKQNVALWVKFFNIEYSDCSKTPAHCSLPVYVHTQIFLKPQVVLLSFRCGVCGHVVPCSSLCLFGTNSRLLYLVNHHIEKTCTRGVQTSRFSENAVTRVLIQCTIGPLDSIGPLDTPPFLHPHMIFPSENLYAHAPMPKEPACLILGNFNRCVCQNPNKCCVMGVLGADTFYSDTISGCLALNYL